MLTLRLALRHQNIAAGRGPKRIRKHNRSAALGHAYALRGKQSNLKAMIDILIKLAESQTEVSSYRVLYICSARDQETRSQAHLLIG